MYLETGEESPFLFGVDGWKFASTRARRNGASRDDVDSCG